MDYIRMVALFSFLAYFALQVYAALVAQKAYARIRGRG